MFKALSVIAGWFLGDGAIAAFFAWIGVKFTSKTAIVTTQIAIVSLLVASRVAFLWAVLEFAKLTINGITAFLKSIPTFLDSSEIMSISYDILRSIGFIDALLDAFSILNTLLIAMLTAWVLKFAFHTAKTTSDEFSKIGMLLQA
jgi:hypothetical protein